MATAADLPHWRAHPWVVCRAKRRRARKQTEQALLKLAEGDISKLKS